MSNEGGSFLTSVNKRLTISKVKIIEKTLTPVAGLEIERHFFSINNEIHANFTVLFEEKSIQIWSAVPADDCWWILRPQRVHATAVVFVILFIEDLFSKNLSRSRYVYSKKLTVSPDALEKIGIKMKNPEEVTLETEYEKIKNIDIDDWEMVRGE